MVRTQVQLTKPQAEGLRRLAARRGVSMARLIREGVDRTLEAADRDALWERAFAVVGKYSDPEPGANVSEDHDRYLVDAYENWRRS